MKISLDGILAFVEIRGEEFGLRELERSIREALDIHSKVVVSFGIHRDLETLLHHRLEILNIFETICSDKGIIDMDPHVDAPPRGDYLREEAEVGYGPGEPVFEEMSAIGVIVRSSGVR